MLIIHEQYISFTTLVTESDMKIKNQKLLIKRQYICLLLTKSEKASDSSQLLCCVCIPRLKILFYIVVFSSSRLLGN